jgi:hypothetical protein
MTSKKVLSADNQQGRLKSLTPWYVIGFVDGEGSFHVALYRDPRMKTGWKVIPEFHVSQRSSSRSILDRLVKFFDCGYVKPNHKTNPHDLTYVFVVRNREELLKKVIPFFGQFSLQTEKQKDFQLFKKIVLMMKDKKHQNSKGIQKIIKIAYQMNGGGRYRKRSLDDLKPSETICRTASNRG